MNILSFVKSAIPLTLAVMLVLCISSCARLERRTMEVTAYCGCGKCNDWTRGSACFLKLDFWNKYITKGPQKGQPYTGRTASGTKPRQVYSGLFSFDSLTHPWKIPFRVLPWRWLPHKGTIAADTKYYSFGTKMHVPGYGWGIVEDRGGAIKGPNRLDLFYNSHRRANIWGRQHVKVKIIRQD